MAHKTLLALIIALCFPTHALADRISSSAGELQIDPVVTGLTEPWAVGFLPGGGLLITERGGRLLLASGGRVQSVSGVPAVQTGGQGGLLDVLVPADFAQSREVLFTYSLRTGRQTVTALGRGILSEDDHSLADVATLFSMESPSSGGQHFGSRIVEAEDGKIFVTIGERGDMDEAQNRANHNGTVIRLNRDGSVPMDNPFVGVDGVQPEIWSFGHSCPTRRCFGSWGATVGQ